MRALLALAVMGFAPGCMSTWDWPDTARPADGVAIRYEQHGRGEPALVFVHGWSCDRQFWTYQLRPFANARHVVAVDLAGHGESEAGRTAWTIEQLGADVATVCDDAGLGRVVLIGHSMGAQVALEAARILGDRCAAVVAVDFLHDVEERMEPARIAEFLAPLRADFAPTIAAWVREHMFPADASPELVDLVVQRISARPPEIALPLLEAVLRYDAAAALERVGCPVHCINGASRRTDVEAGRRHNPRFDAVVMERVGHFGMLEDPAAFNRLLGEYVRSLGASPPEPGANSAGD